MVKKQWLDMLGSLPPETRENLIAAAKTADPTDKKVFTTWILNNQQRGEVRLPEDADAVRRFLSRWIEVKAQIKARDVNHHGFAALRHMVEQAEGTESRRQRDKRMTREGGSVIHEKGRFRIDQITTPQAASVASRHWLEPIPVE